MFWDSTLEDKRFWTIPRISSALNSCMHSFQFDGVVTCPAVYSWDVNIYVEFSACVSGPVSLPASNKLLCLFSIIFLPNELTISIDHKLLCPFQFQSLVVLLNLLLNSERVLHKPTSRLNADITEIYKLLMHCSSVFSPFSEYLMKAEYMINSWSVALTSTLMVPNHFI